MARAAGRRAASISAEETGGACRTTRGDETSSVRAIPKTRNTPAPPTRGAWTCTSARGENPFYEDVFFCMPFRLHGEKCDSGYAGFPSCDKCAPDTDCVGSPTVEDPYIGYCRKECTTADDCPCLASGAQTHDCHEGHCFACAYEGEPCTKGLDVCCSDTYSLECEDSRCCRSDDEVCDDDDECCPGSYCEDHTLCRECTEELGSCTTQGECCGMDCVGGICRQNCAQQDGMGCSTGLQGECASGTYRCVGGYDLVCMQDTPASNELCDGKDNDCDGLVDEDPVDIGGTCETEVPGCPTSNPNVWMEFRGSEICVNGALKCEAIPGTHFCNDCGDNLPIGDCGVCHVSCVLDSHCAPNHACNVQTGACEWEQNCGDQPKCWLPGDKGACPYP